MESDFSMAAIQVRKQWGDIFNMVKKFTNIEFNKEIYFSQMKAK